MDSLHKRLCQFCEEALRGRSDKIFCDDLCRNRFHNKNRKRPKLSEGARNIQRILIKNHRVILTMLGARNNRLVHRDDMLRAGFMFEVYSQQSTNKSGAPVTFCLDLGYRILSPNKVMLYRKGRGLGVYWSLPLG